MKKFSVNMPIAGSIYLEVEAENLESAKKAFYDKVEKISETHPSVLEHPSIDSNWTFYENVVKGNVCYLDDTEVEIEEIND